ncbi:MAG: metallophosphoesterase family protein [Clostridia bacterium]|nr:metallophosphoesterase family protein [Clostridia bacterium]
MKVFLFRSLIVFIVFDLFTIFGPMVFAQSKTMIAASKLFLYPKKSSVYSVAKFQYIRGKNKKRKTHLSKALKSLMERSRQKSYEILMLRQEMKKAIDTLKKQSAILDLEGDTAVIGDVHGDYENLIKIIDDIQPALESGEIKNVLFLGDYIDRGPSSFKTLLILLKFFNENPGKVFLLRGNHETIDMYMGGGGKNLARNEKAFKSIGNDLLFAFFNQLPYAAVINDETLAVHGGVPHRNYWRDFWRNEKISDVKTEHFAPIYSALWSDYDKKGDAKSSGSLRGKNPLLVCYNEGCVREFFEESSKLEYLLLNKICLKYLIRAHQSWLGDFHQTLNKIITTIFSAVKGQDFVELGRKARVAIVKKGMAPELFVRSR